MKIRRAIFDVALFQTMTAKSRLLIPDEISKRGTCGIAFPRSDLRERGIQIGSQKMKGNSSSL